MTRTSRLAALVMFVCARAFAADEPRLHVMAFNVLFKGADDAKSIKAIDDENADVVCLTELTPTFVKKFETGLGKTYPHRVFAPKSGTWGVGFASKRPLLNVRTGPVEPSKIPAMEATVTLDAQRVQLLCVHLVPPVGKRKKSDTFLDELAQNGEVRSKQADTLVARYAKTKLPVVLLGDFNEEPAGEALQKLEKAGWKRGCRFCGATFPGPKEPWPAVFVIDHVYARGLEFTDAKTIRAGGSDHFPVSAKVRIATPPNDK